jgi:hypothetical protein
MRYNLYGNSQRITKLLILFTWLTFLLPGCGTKEQIDKYSQDPDTGPIKSIIKTSVPLAYASSVAMRAVSGDTIANVEVIGGACISYPCSRLVTIYLGEGDLPLNYAQYGLINVYGLWSSDTQAILTTVFTDMNVGSDTFKISSIALTPVLVSGSGFKIVFANINLNISTTPDQISNTEVDSVYLRLNASPSDDVEVSVGMDAWIIEVDTANTVSDFSDDTYKITGGSQGINISGNSAEVTQLGLLRMTMAPECNLNPVGGEILLNQVEVSDTSIVIGQAFFSLGNTCNGEVKVALGLGTYFGATGKSYPLDLNTP